MAVAESQVGETVQAQARPVPITHHPSSITLSGSGKLLIYAVLIVGGVIFVAPFVWMLSGSLQSIGDIFRWPPQWIPRNPTLDNYARFFETQRIGQLFFNSAYVAIAVTFMQLAAPRKGDG